MTDNITPEAVDNDFSPATMDNDTIYIGTRKYVAVDTSRARIEKLKELGCADYIHMALLDEREDLSARVAELEAERDRWKARSQEVKRRYIGRLAQLQDAESKLEKVMEALEDIAGVGFDAPMTFEGTDAEWERRRANAMQTAARATLAKLEAKP